MIVKTCMAAFLVYTFALLCGAFSLIFVMLEPMSFGILARNVIVGWSLSLSISILASAVLYLACLDDVAPVAFGIMMVVFSSAANGFGAVVFRQHHAGSSVVACFFGGFVFLGAGFILYSIAKALFEDESLDAEEESSTVRTVHTECSLPPPSYVVDSYVVVQNPCREIQMAVAHV